MSTASNPTGTPGWSLLGVLLGALGYVSALTPTLLPRTSVTQASACALVAMSFYAIGAIIEGTTRALVRTIRSRGANPVEVDRSPKDRRMMWVRIAITALAVACAALFTPGSIGAQVTQRAIDQVPGEAPNSILVVGITVILCAIVLAIARSLRAAGRGFARLLGHWTEGKYFAARTIVGGLLVGLCAIGIGAVALAATHIVFNNINDATANQVQPTSANRSGGPGSMISWASLGNEGRDFVSGGPTTSQITAVTGRPAQEPIRTYAGVESATTIQECAALAVQDLVRAGGLKRDAIIVYTPSTNGLVDPTSLTAAEYVMGGNSASVSIQYTVLPSFLSLIFSTPSSLDAGTALLAAVNTAVDQLPAEARPRVFVYGESLGAFGSLAPFADKGIEGFLDQVDGAVWAGPPANSAYWQQLNALSTSGPTWQPIVEDGTVIRYAATPAGIKTPPTMWGTSRGLFLQNATDPVVWWSPDLIFNRPGWLADPHGPGVPAEMTWLPLVTFEQVLIDMPPAGGMPAGVGHNYLTTIGDGWVAVLQPPTWSAANQANLQVALGNTASPNAANSP